MDINDLPYIPAADKLPEIGELILTYNRHDDFTEDSRYRLGTYDGMEREFDFTGKRYGDPKPTAQDGEYSWTFTHWMRVPGYHPANGVTITKG